MLGTSITFLVIKYVSLNFTTVTRNLTPLITIFLGACLLGTKIKVFEVFVSLVSLFGVILVIIGFTSIDINEPDQIVTKEDLNSQIALKVAIVGVIAAPILDAWINITSK